MLRETQARDFFQLECRDKAHSAKTNRNRSSLIYQRSFLARINKELSFENHLINQIKQQIAQK